MLSNEFASVLSQPGRVYEWANTVKYKNDLTSEDKDISNVMDAWAKELGRTGHDANHELSAMITKAITPDVVSAPSTLIDRMFDEGSIGEFDDYRAELAPKNTIKVYESVNGGNVDRSFIDFSGLSPKWVTLQAETDLSLQDIRRGGYKTVSTLITFINEALEAKKVAKILSMVDGAVTSLAPGYINETTASPTDTTMKELALYLHDVSDEGTPIVVGLNKYIQAIASLDGATTFLTEKAKDQYNSTGFLTQYSGLELIGMSGQKKLADGSFIIPDKRIFGISGKIGEAITRGETQVLQETDINTEKIHIKVNGYQFGILIKDISKVGKVVLA